MLALAGSRLGNVLPFMGRALQRSRFDLSPYCACSAPYQISQSSPIHDDFGFTVDRKLSVERHGIPWE